MTAPAAHVAWAQVVARNIVPLAGILFLGWNAASVLVLYFVDTLLSMAVIFAGAMRKFVPPITDDGWAARANSEAGMIGGAIFMVVAIAIPIGMPLVFILEASHVSWRELLADPALRAGIVWQVVAAFWSYVGLYRALRYATVEQLRLKRRFALVFLRWMALLMFTYLGVLLLFGRYTAILFVAIYIGISIWSEIAPDRFLRMMPGGAEDADPQSKPVLSEAARNIAERSEAVRSVAMSKRRRRKRH
jgi:hypothetical protein